MDNGTVRWGILGTGKIARIIAGALAECRAGELVAVGSRDIERAESFAAEFAVARAHAGYDGVVEDEQVDLVYVAVAHPFHRRWAVRAAAAGRHVLCEKPLAVNHADAAQIVATAGEHDVFLLEAFAYRCHPQTGRLVELLRDGAIGEVRLVDAVFGYDAGPAPGNYLLDCRLAGGSILDVGCYTTSMAHLVAAAGRDGPAPALDVVAGARIGPTGVDQSTAATLTFGSGLLARVACSVQANLDSTVRIYGSEGRIMVASPWLPGRLGTAARIVVERLASEPIVIDVPLEVDVYTIEVDAVNDAVRAGERSSPAMSWEESLENMRTLDRWRAAIGLRYEQDRRGDGDRI